MQVVLALEALALPIVQVCAALLVNMFVIIQIGVNTTCLQLKNFLARG